MIQKSFYDLTQYADSLGIKPSVIIEVGSRDGVESLAFKEKYPQAKIFCFEPNPESAQVCREAVANSGIEVIEKAVGSENGIVAFYKAPNNVGSSSLYEFSQEARPIDEPQEKTEVTMTTLETFLKEKGVNSIDILWIDVEGAEYEVIKGLGDRIKDVKIIQVETCFKKLFQGQTTFKGLNILLKAKGFRLAFFSSFCKMFADAVYVNKSISKPIMNDKMIYLFNRMREIIISKFKL